MARPVVALLPPSKPHVPRSGAASQLLTHSCRVRTATVGAAFSLLVVLSMAGAALVCADDACTELGDPESGRAVLDVSPGPPSPGAPRPDRGPTDRGPADRGELARVQPGPSAPIAPGPPPPPE
ncbi:MAG TPA: hypothetical protein VNO83_18415 [Pseudonocardia sp.]|nr:hypothetical protein [Pseudonocardia sp.]